MPNNTKEIKRRIKSVNNIGQITKAMELVSASKMRKAQAAATASRPYSILSTELLRNLSGKTHVTNHPLLKKVTDLGVKLTKILIVLISSERGLAGAFNTNVINKAVGILKAEGREKFDFVSVGKKGADVLKRMSLNIVAAFPMKDKITQTEASPIAELAIQDFLASKYEKVFIVYTDFVSTLVQKPNILQLLPFESKEEIVNSKQTEDFLFEPNPEAVLETLITKTIEFAVFQTLLEAAASEHSARMVAMRNANEAAGELIEDLTLTYNQARQAGITRELSEISAAKLAMEG